MSQQTPRRWLTFSLKSLFLSILIVAAYFAGWRSAIWTAEREKEAAVRKAVEELQTERPPEAGVILSHVPVYHYTGPIIIGNPEAAKRDALEAALRDLERSIRPGLDQTPDTDEAPPTRAPQQP